MRQTKMNANIYITVSLKPSSETQGQSVGSGVKEGRKFSSTGESTVLENFRLVFSPDPTDCPWVTEDGLTQKWRKVISRSSGGLSASEKEIAPDDTKHIIFFQTGNE